MKAFVTKTSDPNLSSWEVWIQLDSQSMCHFTIGRDGKLVTIPCTVNQLFFSTRNNKPDNRKWWDQIDIPNEHVKEIIDIKEHGVESATSALNLIARRGPAIGFPGYPP